MIITIIIEHFQSLLLLFVFPPFRRRRKILLSNGLGHCCCGGGGGATIRTALSSSSLVWLEQRYRTVARFSFSSENDKTNLFARVDLWELFRNIATLRPQRSERRLADGL